jgi:hypothetical protein
MSAASRRGQARPQPARGAQQASEPVRVAPCQGAAAQTRGRPSVDVVLGAEDAVAEAAVRAGRCKVATRSGRAGITVLQVRPQQQVAASVRGSKLQRSSKLLRRRPHGHFCHWLVVTSAPSFNIRSDRGSHIGFQAMVRFLEISFVLH